MPTLFLPTSCALSLPLLPSLQYLLSPLSAVCAWLDQLLEYGHLRGCIHEENILSLPHLPLTACSSSGRAEFHETLPRIWLDLVRSMNTVTAIVSSCVQQPCHAPQILFCSKYLLPLTLAFFQYPLPQWSTDLEVQCDIDVLLIVRQWETSVSFLWSYKRSILSRPEHKRKVGDITVPTIKTYCSHNNKSISHLS